MKAAPAAVPTEARVSERAEAAPVATVTEAVFAIVDPPTVAVTVAVPGVEAPGVSTAEYVPLPLSVTEPMVPLVVDIVTVAPPLVIELPAASLSCTVMVEPEPPAVTEVGDAEIVEVEADGIPCVTVNAADVADVSPEELRTR